MLNMTKFELALIPDPGMYLFFEKDMRGQVSYISNKYSKASNKNLKWSKIRIKTYYLLRHK